MFSITAQDVIHLGRSPGGDRFTQFVDALIRAHCYACSTPQSSISTNLRTNIRDGGVDTRVSQPATGDRDKIQWMRDKTIWQYKATDASQVIPSLLQKEVGNQQERRYSTECIEQGYAYRFCVCAGEADCKKVEWENTLNQAIRAIQSDALDARVLTADDLAAWANQFPALILEFFRPRMADAVLHLNAWKQNITDATPLFMNVPTWEPIQQEIRRHLDFGSRPVEVLLSVQGEAGVGKTRLVYEILAASPGIGSLVIYADEGEKAHQIARNLANNEALTAILVADECSLQTREHLTSLLRGCRHRIRVIAIDNAGDRILSDRPEFWLQRIPEDILDEILRLNFPTISREQRRAFAHLSEGFVRLAADMCNHGANLDPSGNLAQALSPIKRYYKSRLTEEQQKIIEVLALVQKVGYKEDVSKELDTLCTFLSLQRDAFMAAADRLHDVPGFVARTSRYYYITPKVIAQVAFDFAWERWIKNDPDAFLSRIPASLLESFRHRVAQSASQEVKRRIGEFFRREADAFEPGDLASGSKVFRFIVLIETDPDTFLPTLRRVVEQATRDELLAEDKEDRRGWGGRRHLVWLCERLAAFSEYFDDAEAILLSLALAESEPHISNNATGVWKHLFQIALSGTSVPFLTRLTRLKSLIYSSDEATSNLAMDAFKAVFDPSYWGRVGDAIVAGRITPKEWHPDPQEYRECMDASVALLQELTERKVPRLREKAQSIALHYTGWLIHNRYLRELKAIFADGILSEQIRPQVVRALERFLHLAKPESSSLSVQDREEVHQWLEYLRPQKLHDRLITAVGIDAWEHSFTQDETQWFRELRTLAEQFCTQPELLKQEIEWLCSENARSAVVFGQELGTVDTSASLLKLVFSSCLQYPFAGLARGYIRGLLDTSPEHSQAVNSLLDSIEEDHPTLVYELAIAEDKATSALERTLRLIDTGRLSTVYLQGFLLGRRHRQLNREEFLEILNRLLNAYDSGEDRMIRLAIDLIAPRSKADQPARSLLYDAEVEPQVWRVLQIASEEVSGSDAYWWARILEAYIECNPERVAEIAADALVGESYRSEEATNILIKVASQYPDIAMKQIGNRMLDQESGWHFFIAVHQNLITFLPEESVINWVSNNGVEAARVLARHLPSPYLNERSEPTVPRLTEFVLTEFAEDEQVFQAFCAGRHSYQMYSGDIAAQHDAEAAIARKFLNHQIRRVREWAQYEIDSASQQAKWWRQREEEERIEV